MIIKRPITATIDRNNRYTTYLHFDRGERVKFYMRGAIGWPEGDKEGFVLMAGQALDTGITYVFEQAWFWTIAPWLNPDGTIRPREDGGYHLGLIQYVQDWQALYKCCSFFHGGQHVDLIRRHSIELYRNPLLPKNIELIEVPYVSEVGDDLIIEKGKTRKYMAQTESPLALSIQQWAKLRTADQGDNNAVHALRALLAGLEYAPHVGER